METVRLTVKGTRGIVDKMTTEEDKKQQRFFNDAAKTLENTSYKMSILSHFKDDLEDRLMQLGACNPHPILGGYVVVDLIQEKFQADSMLAFRYVMNKSDAILSSDLDFATYLGPIGVLISSINISKKRKKNDKANMNIGEVIISE